MKRKRETSSNRPVSAGVLLYKKESHVTKYLLGLVPQRNFWTVFKGMPSDDGETLEETALREFQEETGTENVLGDKLKPETTLRGKTAKKDLVIFLQKGSHVQESMFDIDKVVKIDQGYMKGKPEIVAIRWLTKSQALATPAAL